MKFSDADSAWCGVNIQYVSPLVDFGNTPYTIMGLNFLQIN